MVERTRRGPVKNIAKWVKQFSDPKFNPERRTAMQMLAAAPVGGKLKLAQGALGQALDPVQFYRGLLAQGLDIAPEYLLDPKRMREAVLNELSDAGDMLSYAWKERGGSRADDIYEDAYGQAYEDHVRMLSGEPPGAGVSYSSEWKKVQELFDAQADKKGLGDEVTNALSDYLGAFGRSAMVEQYGADDLFSDYLNAVRGRQMNDYVTSEAARLGIEPEELAERVGLEDFLRKAPKIGDATGGYFNVGNIPEYYYQDPEALRYAALRGMLDHPVLTPQQMLEATYGDYGDITQTVGMLGPQKIAKQLNYDLMPRLDWVGREMKNLDRPLLDTLDLERMHPEVREAFIDLISNTPKAMTRRRQQMLDNTRRRLAEQEPLLQRLDDVRSYVGNRASPFRVRYDDKDAGTRYVNEPLSYMDAIGGLAPEEYGEGGHVG